MKKRKIKKAYFKGCIHRDYFSKRLLNNSRCQKLRPRGAMVIRSNFRSWFSREPKSKYWNTYGYRPTIYVHECVALEYPKRTKKYEDIRQLLANSHKKENKIQNIAICAKCGKEHTKRMKKDWIKKPIKNLSTIGSKYRVFCSEKCYQIYQNIYLKKRI